MSNDDLFLSKDVYEPKGTLEERWGPQGYLVCIECAEYHLCNHMAASDRFYNQSPCRKCGTAFLWVEKNKFEAANPQIFGDRDGNTNT